MKKDNGITLIALIVTIIIMIILATIVVDFSTKAIDKAKLEDIKTNMLLIQGKSQTIYEKYSFKEIEELTGILYSEQNTYVISDGLLDHLKVEDDIYIWGEEALNENARMAGSNSQWHRRKNQRQRTFPHPKSLSARSCYQ